MYPPTVWSVKQMSCLIVDGNNTFKDTSINERQMVQECGQMWHLNQLATACDLCQIVLSNCSWNQHLDSQDHKLHEQYNWYMSAMEQSKTDKNSAVVEGSFDFEIINPPVAKVGKELSVTIKASKPSSTGRSVLLDTKLASVQGKKSGVSS